MMNSDQFAAAAFTAFKTVGHYIETTMPTGTTTTPATESTLTTTTTFPTHVANAFSSNFSIKNFTKPLFTKEPQDATNDTASDLINNDIVQIFFCVLYTTVFVLGVFGNVLVCYVVLRNRAMQTVTNIFITNLALSDILLCVLAVPFTPLYTFMGRWAFGRTLCHLVSFAQGCSIYISTLTLTSIAVDRYFVIIYPFHPRMKLSTCIAIIVTIWVIALLATLPYGMYMKVVSETSFATMSIHLNSTPTKNVNVNATNYNSTEDLAADLLDDDATTTIVTPYFQIMSNTSSKPETYVTTTTSYCEENWPSEHYRKVFGSVTTILQFVLPFLIISICYTWVSIKLNARARAKPGSKSSRREIADRDRKKRTNRMLIAMVAVFGLSWLPLNVVNIFDDFYEKSNEWRFYTLFFFVAHSIAMSSTCYNPFLYAWLNENFRKEFKHVLPCFNPSNNNIINITRGYNRSERNTCGPRLHHGKGGTGGSMDVEDNEDDNGLTQETSLQPNIRDKLLIIPREATYGNGSGGSSVGGGGSTHPMRGNDQDAKAVATATPVNILLNDKNIRQSRRHRQRQRTNTDDDVDSGEEQTVEMRFCETPFVSSSDNPTAVSMLEFTSMNDEVAAERILERAKDQHCN